MIFNAYNINDINKKLLLETRVRAKCWQLPIFPVRRQTSIFGANELNYRVRDGNGWTLIAIVTN